MKNLRLKHVLILFCYANLTFGQTPYEINVKKDAPILGSAAIAQVAGLWAAVIIEPLDAEEIAALDVNDINSFDRKSVFNYSSRARAQSDILLYGSFATPLLVFLDKKVRKDFLTVGVMGAEVVLINGALTTLTKILAQRKRPFTYNPEIPLEDKMTKSGRLSFFSGHTSTVSSASFFIAKIFADCNPDSKWKPVVWSVAALLPATTGYLRVKGGKHFPTDVITGFTVGALVGVLIPAVHKKKKKDQKVTLSLLSNSNKVGITLNW